MLPTLHWSIETLTILCMLCLCCVWAYIWVYPCGFYVAGFIAVSLSIIWGANKFSYYCSSVHSIFVYLAFYIVFFFLSSCACFSCNQCDVIITLLHLNVVNKFPVLNVIYFLSVANIPFLQKNISCFPHYSAPYFSWHTHGPWWRNSVMTYLARSGFWHKQLVHITPYAPLSMT